MPPPFLRLCMHLSNKCKALKSRNKDLCVKIRGSELQIVANTKYLGVQMDCSLDRKGHIQTTDDFILALCFTYGIALLYIRFFMQ